MIIREVSGGAVATTARGFAMACASTPWARSTRPYSSRDKARSVAAHAELQGGGRR